MKLDLSSLANAVSQLEDFIDNYDSDIVRQFPQIKDQMRAGVIQAFEFTYELSHKMIKRYLEQTSANPSEVDGLSFQGLIRRAKQQGLLRSEPDIWMQYRAERGTTSHTYDDEKAQSIFENIPEFLEEARHLLKELQERNKLLD